MFDLASQSHLMLQYDRKHTKLLDNNAAYSLKVAKNTVARSVMTGRKGKWFPLCIVVQQLRINLCVVAKWNFIDSFLVFDFQQPTCITPESVPNKSAQWQLGVKSKNKESHYF